MMVDNRYVSERKKTFLTFLQKKKLCFRLNQSLPPVQKKFRQPEPIKKVERSNKETQVEVSYMIYRVFFSLGPP